MSYNIQKARESGLSDDQIRVYLQKTGRSEQEIQSLLGSKPSSYTRMGAEFAGQAAGQMLGGALAGMPGRLVGGTLGNVAGTIAPEAPKVLKQSGQLAKYVGTLGRTPRPEAPKFDVTGKDLLESAKSGAISSGIGEAIPSVAKGFSAAKKMISPDWGALRGLSKIPQEFTGQTAGEFEALTKKPRGLLYRWMGGYKGASAAWKDFESQMSKAGIEKEAYDWHWDTPLSHIRRHVRDVERLALGGVYSPAEIGLRGSKRLIKVPGQVGKLATEDLIKTVRGINEIIKGPEERGIGQLLKLKKTLLDEVEKRSDPIAKAWRDVANSQLSQSFHESAGYGFLPKIGTFKSFYEARRLLPMLFAGSGAIGAGVSQHPAIATLLAALMSPMAMGVPFAAAGAAGKVMKSPVASAAVAKALDELRKGF